MALPLLTRSPTCLACLRRITSQTSSSAVTPVFTQIRQKHKRPADAGVVVRLLEDVKGFGRKGSIFRSKRGPMRHVWYPKKIAEYMTATRFKELSLTKKDIGERDFLFAPVVEGEDFTLSADMDAVEMLSGSDYKALPETPPREHAPVIEIEHVDAARAYKLLTELIPETLTFERQLKNIPIPKPLPAPAPEPAPAMVRSPLLSARATVSSAASAKPEHQPAPVEEPKEDPSKYLDIHGSVSLRDIAIKIKDQMILNPEAARIHVEQQAIKFIGLEDGTDKVSMIGKWEIEISATSGRSKVEPVRKMIEVVAA